MPMVWNAEADARLFAAVIATSDVKVNYAAVAEKMGPDCTAKAIIHRVGKIKELARKLDDEDGDSTATTPLKTTPKRRGRPSGKGLAVAANDDDDGAEDSPTAKKRKMPATPRGKVQAPSGIKKEQIEEKPVFKVKKAEDSD
ncbi:hypothetical protein ABEF92_001073 [Exophiala dermatitidis]|uniref:Uncharacterized protein n=2 Tax=Exophiala dermatitidis TaxID=5970 RepID=H6BTS2_EXODN|nr:uncharacterized protein HMPREF1120_03633 [Exophiala dermatitidis NIH/UT8656]EHY55499.1 hypothetical protein HMPREF1120_03633 [Exophiala dermatitidis NIH/UT8656]KAJ4503066.1 hypothetical protein HRR75_008171 [Exophiala dermatitidis]KAJ4538572.1 hypothetical protein HRR78_008104 [Exophiala dermatitidis]